MTRKLNHQISLVDEAKADPVEAQELAAATGMVEGSALLTRVFAATGLTQRQLAARIGVSEGRISQVLSGEENLRLSTVARYLHGMGYRLTVSAYDVRTGTVIESGQRAPSRRREGEAMGETAPYTWVSVDQTWATDEPYIRHDGAGLAQVRHVTVTLSQSTENPRNLVGTWRLSDNGVPETAMANQPIEVQA